VDGPSKQNGLSRADDHTPERGITFNVRTFCRVSAVTSNPRVRFDGRLFVRIGYFFLGRPDNTIGCLRRVRARSVQRVTIRRC